MAQHNIKIDDFGCLLGVLMMIGVAIGGVASALDNVADAIDNVAAAR